MNLQLPRGHLEAGGCGRSRNAERRDCGESDGEQ